MSTHCSNYSQLSSFAKFQHLVLSRLACGMGNLITKLKEAEVLSTPYCSLFLIIKNLKWTFFFPIENIHLAWHTLVLVFFFCIWTHSMLNLTCKKSTLNFNIQLLLSFSIYNRSLTVIVTNFFVLYINTLILTNEATKKANLTFNVPHRNHRHTVKELIKITVTW